MGRPLDLTGTSDNFETVDEDGSWLVVHVELVRKQADMASKPESACPVVIGENSHCGVFPIREQNIAWNDWNVAVGDLVSRMVELATFTQAEACPSREW